MNIYIYIYIYIYIHIYIYIYGRARSGMQNKITQGNLYVTGLWSIKGISFELLMACILDHTDDFRSIFLRKISVSHLSGCTYVCNWVCGFVPYLSQVGRKTGSQKILLKHNYSIRTFLGPNCTRRVNLHMHFLPRNVYENVECTKAYVTKHIYRDKTFTSMAPPQILHYLL